MGFWARPVGRALFAGAHRTNPLQRRCGTFVAAFGDDPSLKCILSRSPEALASVSRPVRAPLAANYFAFCQSAYRLFFPLLDQTRRCRVDRQSTLIPPVQSLCD